MSGRRRNLELVLVGEHLLHQVVALSERQLLAVFALHDRLVFVERVWREELQMAKLVQHEFGLPLNWKVAHVRNRILIATEQVRFQVGVRLPHQASETLVATTFIHRENQDDDWVGLAVPAVPGLDELFSRAVSGRPDAVLSRD